MNDKSLDTTLRPDPSFPEKVLKPGTLLRWQYSSPLRKKYRLEDLDDIVEVVEAFPVGILVRRLYDNTLLFQTWQDLIFVIIDNPIHIKEIRILNANKD